MMIFFWAILAYILYRVWISQGGQFSGGFPKQEGAEEVLKRRYVNGEIDEETYNRMKSQL